MKPSVAQVDTTTAGRLGSTGRKSRLDPIAVRSDDG